MLVRIESGSDNGYGIQHHLRILSGYRQGELVRLSFSEAPLFDVNEARLRDWAKESGYEVEP